ncbi:MAG: pirin family protein [Chitinispirillaceae bacterium]|nr:pirin family protein [Chitinispirillaceae bacterium]
MSQKRAVAKMIQCRPVIEGAGVHLNRVFGFGDTESFDPFLLLDDFRSGDPEKFLPGFPWHPHRGIETITYMLEGSVKHGDSMGNSGCIGKGDVQWMTAGSGIIHQEMPKGDDRNRMGGFQLWANLPASHKMMPPRYREVKSTDIPAVTVDHDVTVRIIAGEVNGVSGPVGAIVTEPEYLDVTMAPDSVFIRDISVEHNVFAYMIEGSAYVDNHDEESVSNGTLVLFGDGEQVAVTTRKQSARLLLISGKPLREPVAWQGPIVMNTREELQTAFEEYANGTFIRHHPQD